MENTLGRNPAQGIFSMLHLFKCFNLTGYNLARLESCQIAAFRRSKDFAVDDGLCSSIDSYLSQVRFRIGNRVADIFAESINKCKLQRFRFRFDGHGSSSFLWYCEKSNLSGPSGHLQLSSPFWQPPCASLWSAPDGPKRAYQGRLKAPFVGELSAKLTERFTRSYAVISFSTISWMPVMGSS